MIWHNRKFAGYTVRLEAGQDKWAALSPYGALVGETNTHIEALSLLAPDAASRQRKPASTWTARPPLLSAGADSPWWR